MYMEGNFQNLCIDTELAKAGLCTLIAQKWTLISTISVEVVIWTTFAHKLLESRSEKEPNDSFLVTTLVQFVSKSGPYHYS